MERICSDLEQEYEALDSRVFSLDRRKWDLPTPFYDWILFDQVLHIAFFDHEALLALEEPDRFRKRAEKILWQIGSGRPWPQWTQTISGVRTPAGLQSYWRTVRARLVQRLGKLDPGDRLPWYGPDMSARSLASARIMETWAHGQDIFDALGKKRQNKARLYHVAHMGVTTFKWSFRIRGMEPPAHPPRIHLLGPGHESWEWKESGCRGEVRGSAEEFCLVVTQRRNLADTRLKWEGPRVGEWLSMAQAFAGIPQDPPLPGVRVIDYESGK